ncbi:MAG: AraC family transcriptional regulator [Planctomycetota bacterium]
MINKIEPQTNATYRASTGRRVWGGRVRVDRPVYRHDHEFFEIAVIVAGTGRHQTLYGETALRVRDVVLLQPGAWHSYAAPRGLVVRNWCVHASVIRHELHWLLHEPGYANLLWHRPADADQAGLALTRLDREAFVHAELLGEREDADGFAEQVRAVGAVIELLAMIVSAAGYPRDTEDRLRPHRAVLAAVSLLNETYAEPWSLPRIARRVHVEPSYLARLFTRHTGLPPMAYLNRLRLERAAALLLSGELPVGVVGQRVGLDDPNYFARRFRQHFGQSPSGFRAQHLA